MNKDKEMTKRQFERAKPRTRELKTDNTGMVRILINLMGDKGKVVKGSGSVAITLSDAKVSDVRDAINELLL